VVIYRPAPVDFEGLEPAGRREFLRLAKAAKLEVIDLSPAFDSVVDRNTLMLAKWDQHTNALGHRLLADKLYQGLVPLLFGSPSKQQVSHLQKP
jgi:lysophospholipase L1-like esterase